MQSKNETFYTENVLSISLWATFLAILVFLCRPGFVCHSNSVYLATRAKICPQVRYSCQYIAKDIFNVWIICLYYLIICIFKTNVLATWKLQVYLPKVVRRSSFVVIADRCRWLSKCHFAFSSILKGTTLLCVSALLFIKSEDCPKKSFWAKQRESVLSFEYTMFSNQWKIMKIGIKIVVGIV